MGAVRSFRAGFKGGGDPETQALCALRSAELLEAGDLAKAALADASEGAAIGPSGWGYRCALLAAEALIEGGRHDEAMTILKPVMAERVPSRFLEAAGVLFGISLNERGQRETAFKVWRAIGESGVSTHARIDAFERWGAEVLKGGDIAGAAGVLHLCRSSMGSAAFEATETGVEVRALLRRSSLATAIARTCASSLTKVFSWCARSSATPSAGCAPPVDRSSTPNV